MSEPLSATRRALLPLALATAATVQAQVMGLPPSFLPLPPPKYYLGQDLGPVADGVPVGCLSRNGALYINVPRSPAGTAPYARAMRVFGNQLQLLSQDMTTSSWVTACNDQGEAAGVVVGKGGVIWDHQWADGVQNLSQTATNNVQVSGINNARQLAVITTTIEITLLASVWQTSLGANDQAISKRSLTYGGATAINAAGHVTVDAFTTPGGNRRAMLFPAGLPGLSLSPQNAVSSWTTDIDDQSRVVGGMVDAAGVRRGYLWHATEGFQLLEPASVGPRPLQGAEALALGPERTVVGVSSGGVAGVPPQATVWFRAGRARNLNHEAQMPPQVTMPSLRRAVAISDDGAILCEAVDSAGQRRAVLLRPQPGGRWSLLL